MPKFAPWQALIGSERPLRQLAIKHVTNHACDSDVMDGFNTYGNARQGSRGPFALSCPRCRHTIDASRRTLFKLNRCCYVTCPSCAIHCTASKWQCVCSKTWVACELCRGIGFSCKNHRLSEHYLPVTLTRSCCLSGSARIRLGK